jgi:hypothetical protein
MKKKPERPMWTGELGDELIATMRRHGTKPEDRDEMYQICSILMIALLRGELLRGLNTADLHMAIDQVADLHHRAVLDFSIAEGTIVAEDCTIGSAIAVYPEDQKKTH